jgi:hypothetical protein
MRFSGEESTSYAIFKRLVMNASLTRFDLTILDLLEHFSGISIGVLIRMIFLREAVVSFLEVALCDPAWVDSKLLVKVGLMISRHMVSQL